MQTMRNNRGQGQHKTIAGKTMHNKRQPENAQPGETKTGQTRQPQAQQDNTTQDKTHTVQIALDQTMQHKTGSAKREHTIQNKQTKTRQHHITKYNTQHRNTKPDNKPGNAGLVKTKQCNYEIFFIIKKARNKANKKRQAQIKTYQPRPINYKKTTKA